MKKSKRISSIIVAAAATAGIFAGTAAPITATPITRDTTAQPTVTNNKFKFNKNLELHYKDNDAQDRGGKGTINTQIDVPTVTFYYTLAAVTGTSGVVVPGVAPTTTDPGNPTIYDGVVTNGFPKLTTGQDKAVYDATGDDWATITDNTTTPATTSYKANEKMEVDFSGVTWTKPGIFRYKVTETKQQVSDSNTAAQKGIVMDEYDVRYMDVYVINNPSFDPNTAEGPTNPKYIINAVQMFKVDNSLTDKDKYVPKYKANDTDPTVDGYNAQAYAEYDKTGQSVKSDTFENDYYAADLKLTKTVKGALGDKNRDFTFTISNLTGPKNTVLYDSKGKQLEFDANGALAKYDNAAATSYTVVLKHGQDYTIFGLPYDSTFTITEDDHSADGYTTEREIKYTVDGTTTETNKNPNKEKSLTTGAKAMTSTAATTATTPEKIAGVRNNQVDYVNTKDAVTPTGVATQYLPFIIMAGAGVAVVVIFAVRKKRSEAED